MSKKVILASAAAVLVAAGFLGGYAAGYAAGKRQPEAATPMDRYANMMIEETKRNRIQEDARMEEAEALQKAFMNKLGRDYRKLQDKNSEPARDEQ